MKNVYTQFIELLPKRPLQVGTVTDYSGGQARIELPGGGILYARGNASVGSHVFVRDGAIEGDAPNLPTESAEV